MDHRLGFVINLLPHGVRYSFVGMIQLHRGLEEAAVMAGADPLTSFRRIVLPCWLHLSFLGGFFSCCRTGSANTRVDGGSA